MHPLKARGRGQTRLFGYDLLKRGFEGINVRNLAFKLFAQVRVALETNHPRQAHGGFTAAVF
ncbi:hypothetical protein D3C81_1539260 [compost metagenome]